MTLIRRGSAKQKYEARRAWLCAHPDQFAGVPGINEDVTDAGRVRLEALREQLQARDLLGTKATEGQREAIRRLVSELRGEGVGKGWGH